MEWELWDGVLLSPSWIRWVVCHKAEFMGKPSGFWKFQVLAASCPGSLPSRLLQTRTHLLWPPPPARSMKCCFCISVKKDPPGSPLILQDITFHLHNFRIILSLFLEVWVRDPQLPLCLKVLGTVRAEWDGMGWQNEVTRLVFIS